MIFVGLNFVLIPLTLNGLHNYNFERNSYESIAFYLNPPD